MFLTSSGPAGGRRTWSEVLDLPGTGPVVLHNNTKRETSFGELGYASSSVVQAGSVPESHPLLLQCSLLLLLGVPFCALPGCPTSVASSSMSPRVGSLRSLSAGDVPGPWWSVDTP